MPQKRKVKRGPQREDGAVPAAARGGGDMKVLPKRDRPVGPFTVSSVRLPKALLEEVEELAEERGYSRNIVMYELMRAGLVVARQEQAAAAEALAAVEETKQLRAQVDALLNEVQLLKRKRQ